MTARFPARPAGIAYGGDYNPEQWPREVQLEDVELMREAGVTMVSVAIFAWALLEPEEGRYEFGWLDEIVDRLHANGIAVDLATPTAATPAWFVQAYPDSLPVTREGVRVGFGGREHSCPSSPDYRAATARLATAMAEHYRDHPALVLWHVHNEYGAPLGECYCPASVRAFRTWLRARYGNLDALNDAWGTIFWSQRYTDWEQIDAPRHNHTAVNPAQRLDFARFTSDEHLACYTLQRDILHQITPDVPVTTNFMTTNCKSMDLWKWAREVDVVSNNHYLNAEEPDNHLVLSMSADLARSVGGGRPWIIMEHSTSAVNWQPRNIAKGPGELRRNSLTHVARGADGVMFFQWRASRFGAEKFHSAMVPQGGTGTQVWRDVVALGGELSALSAVRGEPVPAEVAVVWDFESYWALELDWRPSVDLAFRERVDAYYAELWREHVTVDFVHPESDLTAYKVVVAPSLYLLGEAGAKNLHAYVHGGGTLVVSYFSGIVDEHDTVPVGPYPGALRDTLGLWVEEFHPLRAGERVALDGGGDGRIWSEHVHLAGASQVRAFASGPDAGRPAVTRNAVGDGHAWYVATAPSDLRDLLGSVLDAAGVDVPVGLPDTLEVVVRGSQRFLVNHGSAEATAYGVTVPAGEIVVVPA
ncbi:beta-galactosidase [Hamadaea flava]|uniref:Beta-galactosidase n=1 Tax=Hamadaea flava TaxID=1742688 RepID=A0ABV8M027_9ACTN|nr:beta-galactosidase [Hamadaea flava]MCP2328906.1 beta-galactosidase [Hamadaea flava]